MAVAPGGTARAARAGEAFVAGHAELREVLDHRAGVLAAAADKGGPVHRMRNLPRAFLADEVLPHARAEERTLYPAAGRAPDASLLVRALTSDHRDLIAMAVRLDEPAPPAAAHRRPDRGGRRGEPVGGVPGGGSAGRSGRRRLGSSRRHAV